MSEAVHVPLPAQDATQNLQACNQTALRIET